MDLEKKYLNPKEAAEYLNVSEATLKQWRREGRGMKYKRISHKKVLYLVSDIDDWMQECEYGNNWVQVGDAIKGDK